MRSNSLSFAITSLFLFLTISIFAQEKVEVEKTDKTFNEVEYDALSVDIPQAELKDVQKALSKWAKEKGKVKEESHGSDVYFLGAEKQNIAASPINIYSSTSPIPHGVRVVLLVEADSAIIQPSTHKETYESCQFELRKFGVGQYAAAVQKELDAEEKALKKLEQELEKLYKENESHHKDIKKNEREIDKMKQEIELLKDDEARIAEQIIKQKDEIVKLKSSSDEIQKIADKELKSLENDLKKAQKELDRNADKIFQMESEIRDLERDIEKNVDDQGVKKKEIDTQTDKKQDVKNKLDNIK